MFISSHRFDPFQEFNTPLDSFWNDDFFNTLSVFSHPQKTRFSKEDKLKKQLNRLQNEENDIAHYIKLYENQLEQLKKNHENVQKQRTKVTDKISKLIEENKKKIENATEQSSQQKQPQSESYVFKRVNYKTNDMEIEEQYDSANPKNCYKIIRKQGEAPQIIQGEQAQQQIENKVEQKTGSQEQQQQLPTGQNEKYEQLCKMVGKQSTELENLVNENKDLSIGQLFDKASELKLI